MAALVKEPHPDFLQQPGENYRRYSERITRALEALRARSAALPATEVVGAVLQFSVADGYAYYLVTKERPLTFQHLPLEDNYTISPVYIRGFRRGDVVDQLQSDRAFRAAFPGAR